MTHSVSTHPVSPSRIFFCLIILIALVAVTAWAFQARSLDVTPSAGARVETAPGKLLTLSFKVTNTSSTRKRIESIVVTPKGWRRLAKDFPFELDGGASDIRLMSVSIPAETPAGQYALKYGVRDAANPADAAEVAVAIVVTAVKEQGLKLIDAPRIAVAGDAYVSTFLITNKGNIVSTVRLTPVSSTRFPAVADSAMIHLQPGESRTITVKVKTDPSITSKVQDVLELTAELDAKNSVSATSYVEVVPRVTGVEERYIEFPLWTRLRFAGSQAKNGAQLEIAGSGSLSDAKDDRLDLLIRTPDIQQKSILGQRDEYQLSYSRKTYDIYLGDKNFSLSPLTEFNRYAIGGSANALFNKIGVGGFYNQTRFVGPRQQELAGFVSYHLLDAAQVGVNYLGKRDDSTSNVVSLRSIVQPTKTSEIDVEYGMSKSPNLSDDALAARWSGRSDWISYDARYIHSGPKFAGYYRDLNLKNLSLNIAPVSELRFEGYYHDEQRNLNLDSSQQLAPRDRYYQAGIGFGSIFAVYYRTNDQDDLLPVPHYRRREDAWQIRAGYNLSGLTLLANADVGSILDKIADTKNPYRRYTGFLSIQPFAGQTFGFTAEYTKERDPVTLEEQERFAGSVSANLSVAKSTQFTMSLYGNRSNGTIRQTYTLLDLTLDHQFPWGHSLVIRGRQSTFTPSVEGKEIAYMAEYAIPIGVPIARSHVNGQLIGRVVDSEKGTGIQNALVYAGGATALTDRNGDYYFPSLKPDKYFVQLDMTTVGLNRVTLQVLPYEVTIVGGQDSRFDISLSRSVTVTGTVLMFGMKEQASNDTTPPVIVELGGHPNVVLELSNGADINRRVTDNKGRFAFTGIRPGPWTLRVIEGNLPQNYSLDRDSYDLTIVPGESVDKTFKAIPRRRRIQMIQQGKTIVAAPSKPGQAEKETVKKVEPEPQKPKPVEVAAPKKVLDTASKIEVRKPKIAPSMPAAKALEVQCDVVFVPDRLIFVIEHSTWTSKTQAISEAERISKLSALPAIVQRRIEDGKRTSYVVLLGAFKSRMAAEVACRKIQDLR